MTSRYFSSVRAGYGIAVGHSATVAVLDPLKQIS